MPSFRFLAFGCSHAPLTHAGYWEWLIRKIEWFKPDYVVNCGDWYEGLAGTRHAKDPRHDWDLFDEHRAVAEQATAINFAAPNATKVWISGNHDDNAFGIHADRIPSDLRRVSHWQSNEAVQSSLAGWIIKDRYRHGERYYLGQISFGHGCPVTDASAKDECYLYGVPYGLDIRSHTHRPEPVTQCRERKVILPYWYANTGTGADWDRMYYMDRQSKALWGRGCVIGEVSCRGEGREVRATKNWSAETLIHSWAHQNRDLVTGCTWAPAQT